MAQRILINNDLHELDWLLSTSAGQVVLKCLHQVKHHVRCACIPGGIEMYVGRRGSHYYISRMPGSGALHDTRCQSVEDHNYLTGSTFYHPNAIVENCDGSLVVDFNQISPKQYPLSSLSSDGLFDLLIEQSNLNRHQHRPQAARATWATTRESLLIAAQSVIFRGKLDRLADHLVVPSAFNPDLSSDQQDAVSKSLEQTERAIICAPFKELKQSQFGWLLLLKHLPNLRFWVSQDVIDQANIDLTGQPESQPLPRYALCFGEVRKGRKPGNFIVTSLSVRATDAAFMPCGSDAEATVANQLRSEGLSFLRPLRFEAPYDVALADFALLDERMTPIFVLAPTGKPELDAARRALAGVFERNGGTARFFHPPAN